MTNGRGTPGPVWTTWHTAGRAACTVGRLQL